MGTIVITHGFAHRLRNDGLIESAPFDDEKLTFGEWQFRNITDMDLSGGDFEEINHTLKRFRTIFALSGRRTPVVTEPLAQQSLSPEATV